MQRFRLLICNESFKLCHISRRISIRILKNNLKAMTEKGDLDRAESGLGRKIGGRKRGSPAAPRVGGGKQPCTSALPRSHPLSSLLCSPKLSQVLPRELLSQPTKRNPSWDGVGVPTPVCLSSRGRAGRADRVRGRLSVEHRQGRGGPVPPSRVPRKWLPQETPGCWDLSLCPCRTSTVPLRRRKFFRRIPSSIFFGLPRRFHAFPCHLPR